jgi:hypothetical protein
MDSNNPVPRGLLFILDEPARHDARAQIEDDDFHKLLWRLHDSGKCVVPDCDWMH